MLMKIFVPKEGKLSEQFMNVHNDEVNDLYVT
jgi:hypothetical protein